MIITIDGPTASGKSTVAKLLAKKLNFVHLNSGLLYRGIAYVLVKFFNYSEQDLISPKPTDLDQIILNHKLVYKYENQQAQVWYEGQDLTPYLKNKEVDNFASISSAAPQVRASLMSIQRQVAQSNDVIAEGRDTGTVVFPKADRKIFLTADLTIRADRWQKSMLAIGKNYTLEESMKLVDARDQRDISRHLAPLKPAQDSIVIDSSNLTCDQVIAKICEYNIKKNI